MIQQLDDGIVVLARRQAGSAPFLTAESVESADQLKNPCDLCVLCGKTNTLKGDHRIPKARHSAKQGRAVYEPLAIIRHLDTGI